MDHYPINTKFGEKKINPKTFKNVRNSLKFYFVKVPDALTTNKRISQNFLYCKTELSVLSGY